MLENRFCENNPAETFLPRLVEYTFFAILIANFALFLILSANNILKNVPVYEGGEDLVFYNTKLLMQGIPIYSKTHTLDFPFFTNYYPPVYYYMLAALFKIFGASNIVGRFACFFLSIMSAWLIAMIVRNRGGSWKWALAAAGIFLYQKPVILYSTESRVDFPALFFALLGIWWYFKFEKRGGIAWLSLVFFVISFFTKQVMLAGVAALTISFFLGNRKQGLLYGTIFVAMSCSVFFALNAATNGGFQYHFLGVHNIDPAMKQGYALINIYLSDSLTMILLSCAMALFVFGETKRFEFYFVALCFFKAMATIFYHGAYLNYFLELCAALGISFGFFMSRFQSQGRVKTLIACFLLGATLQSTLVNLRILKLFWFNSKTAATEKKYTDTALEELSKRYIGNENILFEDSSLPVMLGWKLNLYCPRGYNAFEQAGYYKTDKLYESIAHKKWKAIVLADYNPDLSKKIIPHFYRLSRRQINAVDANYRIENSFNARQKKYTLYVPR